MLLAFLYINGHNLKEVSVLLSLLLFSLFFLINPHPRTCSVTSERRRDRDRDISWLPPVHAWTWDRTRNLWCTGRQSDPLSRPALALLLPFVRCLASLLPASLFAASFAFFTEETEQSGGSFLSATKHPVSPGLRPHSASQALRFCSRFTSASCLQSALVSGPSLIHL